MQDALFIYMDFVLTLSRLHTIISKVLKQQCNVTDITHSQALYMMYLVEQCDIDFIDEHKINSKHFYYIVSKLVDKDYIKTKFVGKTLKSIHPTDKGKILINNLSKIFEYQIKELLFAGLVPSELSHIITLIYRFEKFWIDKIVDHDL